jgi:hypothetical protein
MYVIESTLRINLHWTNINEMWNIEIDICAMFKIKYGLNIMHSIIFSYQVGWFDGKGVDIHPWSPKSNFTSDIVVVNNGMLTICTLHS